MKARYRSPFSRRNAASTAATALLMTLASPAFAGSACMLDDGTTGGSSMTGDASIACGLANNNFLVPVSAGAGFRSSALAW